MTGCSQLSDLIQSSIETFTTTIYGTANIQSSSSKRGIVVSIAKQSSSTSSFAIQSSSYSKVAETDSNGFFEFSVTSEKEEDETASSMTIASSFPSGIYSVKFEKDGYEPVVVSNIPIVLGTGSYEIDDITLYKEYITVTNSEFTDTGAVAEFQRDYYTVEIIDNIPSNTKFIVYYPDSPVNPKQHDYSIHQLENIGIGSQIGRMLIKVKDYDQPVKIQVRPR